MTPKQQVLISQNVSFYILSLQVVIFLIFISLDIKAEELSPVILTDQSCSPQLEICGNGIDENCDGIDLACPGNDKDADGYTSTDDCEDLNPDVYPGVTSSCNSNCGDGVRTCLNTGNYSSCSCSPVCDAPNGSKCYYVDPIAGNDQNVGSFSNRKRSIASFSSTGISTNKIVLKAGDRVYIFSGILPITGNNTSLYLIGVKGESAKPIVISNYPGTTPIIENKTGTPSIQLTNTSYLNFVGLTLHSSGPSIEVDSSSNILFERDVLQVKPLGNESSTFGINFYNSTEINLKRVSIMNGFQNRQKFNSIMSRNSSNIFLSFSYIN